MTTEEKLQQLFQAALKSSDSGHVTRAHPPKPAAPAAPPGDVALAPAAPAAVPDAAAVAVSADPVPAEVTPAPNAGLDEKTSGELGRLLDEQNRRIKLRNRRQRIIGLAASIALFGGGAGWFASSPDRVSALGKAVAEIRSVGDIKAIMASYQASLDQIATRGNHIDEATTALGASTELGADEDAFMNEEMKQLMGGEGKTTGERNQILINKYGDGVPDGPSAH